LVFKDGKFVFPLYLDPPREAFITHERSPYMDIIKQYLTDPTFLGFAALVLAGLFLPQIRGYLSKIRLPKPTPDEIIEGNTLQDAEDLAIQFAAAGNIENTMLAVAMMKSIIDKRGEDILQICADCKAKNEEEESDE
jgi:hypothetical protein